MTVRMRRFAGQEQQVIDPLLADKYRYLEPEGSLLAQQLGMESPKDRRIRELEKQLSGAGQ